jgi:hypothetical protein
MADSCETGYFPTLTNALNAMGQTNKGDGANSSFFIPNEKKEGVKDFGSKVVE